MTNMMVRRGSVSPWAEIDRMWDSLIRESQDSPRKPVVRVREEDEQVLVTAELPGFSARELDIQVNENLLTIKALKRVDESAGDKEAQKEGRSVERAVFESSFVIPEDLDRERFSAEMRHGLLTLTLPRKEKAAPLTIEVKG